LAVLGIEVRGTWLVDKNSTTWLIPQFFFLSIFFF
jgi:hypothetical protein